jgi:flagellin
MSITVNPNNPILTALQDLNAGSSAPSSDVAQTSGDSASDDAVAIGQGGASLSALGAVQLSLGRASSISDVAISAAQTIQGMLGRLQTDAAAAQDPTLDATARQGLNSDYKATLAQITSTVGQSSFDGANLLDGSSPSGVKVLASADGGSLLTLSSQDLTLGGPNLTVSATSSLGTASAAAGALSEINASIPNLQSALATLTSQADQIAAHGALVAQASGALQTSGGAEDADGARLLALQIQQQLSSAAAPIANQAPQLVLSLFR